MLKNKSYIYQILDYLMKKYHKRVIRYGTAENGRRIILKITKVYGEYEKPNADVAIKAQVNEAVRALERMQYVSAEPLAYSDDFVKIYLKEEKIAEIEGYMEKQFGILARSCILEDVRRLAEEYGRKGELTSFYCEKLKQGAGHSVSEIDIERERELLKILAFIQDNEEELYVREVSALVCGNSKHFEEKRYEAICSIIREATGQPANENEPYDDILQQYHISNVEQEICIKGDFLIEIRDRCFETKYLKGGLALSSRDIRNISQIIVRTEYVMTIENKTSYYRFEREDCSELYLGGYANRHQIEFIKKIHYCNKECRFLHFGDIDIGGLLIHQHLCNATGVDFELFHMGKAEIRDAGYQQALIALTDYDRARADKLLEKTAYQEIVSEMLEKGVKLEQEIVSYRLMKGRI